MQNCHTTTDFLNTTNLSTNYNGAVSQRLELWEIQTLYRMPKRFIKKVHQMALAKCGGYLRRPPVKTLHDYQFISDRNEKKAVARAEYEYQEARRQHLHAAKAGNTKTMKEVARTKKNLKNAKAALKHKKAIKVYVQVWQNLGHLLLEHIGGTHLHLIREGEEAFKEEAELRADRGIFRYQLGIRDARQTDPYYHLKAIRREVREKTLHATAILGMIGNKEPYSAWESVNQYRAQQETMKAWAARYELRGPDGQAIPMIDILDSQAQTRFNMLYALLSSLHQIAQEEERIALMVTLTLPSEYHSNPASGSRIKFDPTLSPARGAKELQRRWSCIRADVHKLNIFGAWVIEPHKDGTAHRHALVWVKPDDISTFKAIVRRYFSGDIAADFKAITKDKGASAVSYFAKYLVKTIDGGHKVIDPKTGELPVDGDHLEARNAERVTAWRKGIRARAFDFFGLRRGTVTAWHAIARFKDEPEDPIFNEVWKAIKEKRGGDALRTLGALPWLSEGPTTYIGYACIQTEYGDWTKVALRLISDTGGVIEFASDWTLTEVENPPAADTTYSYSHVSKGKGDDPPGASQIND